MVYVIEELGWIEDHYKVVELAVNIYFSTKEDAREFLLNYKSDDEYSVISKPIIKDGVEYVVEYELYNEDEFNPNYYWKSEGSAWRRITELKLHG